MYTFVNFFLNSQLNSNVTTYVHDSDFYIGLCEPKSNQMDRMVQMDYLYALYEYVYNYVKLCKLFTR